MIRATIEGDKRESQLVTVEDGTGKAITICSSKVPSAYFSPRQLVQSALSGCLLITVKREMMEAGLTFEDIVAFVDMDGDNPTFLYNVEVKSNEDPEVVEACRQHAIADCFIHNLLASDITVREASLAEMSQSAASDRCCG